MLVFISDPHAGSRTAGSKTIAEATGKDSSLLMTAISKLMFAR